MVVETISGQHADMDRAREEIHEVIPMDVKILDALASQVDSHRAAMGFFTAQRNGQVVVGGGADVRTVAHPQMSDQLVRQLVLANGVEVQPLVQIATAEDGMGKIVSFFDRHAKEGMVSIEQVLESDHDIPQHVEIVVPDVYTDDPSHESYLDPDLLRDVTFATNQAVNRAIQLYRDLQNQRKYGIPVPRPDQLVAVRAQVEADAEAFVVMRRKPAPKIIFEAE